MEDEPELEISPLSQLVSSDGRTVKVEIYRSEGEPSVYRPPGLVNGGCHHRSPHSGFVLGSLNPAIIMNAPQDAQINCGRGISPGIGRLTCKTH